MADSISNVPDSELLDIAQNAANALNSDPASYGTTAAAVLELQNMISTLSDSIADNVAKKAAAKAAASAKRAARAEVSKVLRSLRNIAKAGGTSKAKMAELGIPAMNSRAPSNATVPAGSVNTSERLRHTIHWVDAGSPDTKRKPRGVMGCEIWVKLDGPPPGNEKDCHFLTLDASTPFLVEHAASDAGKMAHYMLRWRLQNGSVSGWGDTISATITG
jgi:hypothetical protein